MLHAMDTSTRAPPDANNPSAARSYREREGTGLLCVTTFATRGFLRLHSLQQHICTSSADPQGQLATDPNSAVIRRVWRAEAVRESPLVAELRWSCTIQWKLGCCDHIVGCSAAAAAIWLEATSASALEINTVPDETSDL